MKNEGGVMSSSKKKKPPVVRDNTPEDEARIAEAAKDDPDALPRTDEQLSGMKRGRGRPRGRNKTKIGIGLDKDVAAFYQGLGRGYQSKINDILRKAMEDVK